MGVVLLHCNVPKQIVGTSIVRIHLHLGLQFRQGCGKPRFSVARQVSESKKVVRLPYRTVLGDSLLEFQNGIVVQLSFPICHAKVDVDACSISEACDKVVKHQAGPAGIIQLEVRDPQQIGNIKTRRGDHCDLQVFAGAFVVFLSKQDLAEKGMSPRVVGSQGQNLFRQRACLRQLLLLNEHLRVVEASVWIVPRYLQSLIKEIGCPGEFSEFEGGLGGTSQRAGEKDTVLSRRALLVAAQLKGPGSVVVLLEAVLRLRLAILSANRG